MCHASRTHRVDLDRLYDRTNLDPITSNTSTHHNNWHEMKQINKGRSPTVRHVSSKSNTSTQHSKGYFTRDGWTQLTLLHIMTHTTVTQRNLPVSSAVVNLLFSSMSKCARESFATSASATQKPVHCAAMIATPTSDKNAHMDYHAAPPPEYRAGGDPKREDLCQHVSQTFNITMTGGSSSRQLEAGGASSGCLKIR